MPKGGKARPKPTPKSDMYNLGKIKFPKTPPAGDIYEFFGAKKKK